MKTVREIESDTYGRVIELRLPTRYYWNKDGTFDGIEITMGKNVLDSETLLVQEVFQQLEFLIREYKNKDWNLKDIR